MNECPVYVSGWMDGWMDGLYVGYIAGCMHACGGLCMIIAKSFPSLPFPSFYFLPNVRHSFLHPSIHSFIHSFMPCLDHLYRRS